MTSESEAVRSAETNAFLTQLFRAHGLEALVEDEWVVFPKRYIKANGSVVKATDVQGSNRFNSTFEYKSGWDGY